jgi:H+/Cl- antiporter ClcA
MRCELGRHYTFPVIIIKVTAITKTKPNKTTKSKIYHHKIAKNNGKNTKKTQNKQQQTN